MRGVRLARDQVPDRLASDRVDHAHAVRWRVVQDEGTLARRDPVARRHGIGRSRTDLGATTETERHQPADHGARGVAGRPAIVLTGRRLSTGQAGPSTGGRAAIGQRSTDPARRSFPVSFAGHTAPSASRRPVVGVRRTTDLPTAGPPTDRTPVVPTAGHRTDRTPVVLTDGPAHRHGPRRLAIAPAGST